MLKELDNLGTSEFLQCCKCKVINYTERHMLLCIMIYHEEMGTSARYLNFTGVYYFEGPMFWKGANFIEASNQISFDIWKRVYPKLSDQRIQQVIKIFPVYTVQTENMVIKVACGNVSISELTPLFPRGT